MKVKCVCKYSKCHLGENGGPKEFYIPKAWVKKGEGKYCCNDHKHKDMSKRFSGENSWNWQGGLTYPHCMDCGKQIKHGHKRCKNCASIHNSGKNNCNYGKGKYGKENPNWKGGITPLCEQIRHSEKYNEWRLAVFTQDNFTCQDCGSKISGTLNAHHIKEFIKILRENNITTFEQALTCERLWDVNNGITLCEDCHIERHAKQSFEEGEQKGLIRGIKIGYIKGRLDQKQLDLFKK